jgi:hypothetical protein
VDGHGMRTVTLTILPVRCRYLHGCHAQPPVLRSLPPDLRLRRPKVNGLGGL